MVELRGYSDSRVMIDLRRSEYMGSAVMGDDLRGGKYDR